MYYAIIYDVNLSDFEEYPPNTYKVYDTISELKISDESNIIDLTIPVAEATFTLETNDSIKSGMWCEIRSGNEPSEDISDLWFRGLIKEANYEDDKWSVVVESLLAKLDELDTAAKMYENDTVLPAIKYLFDLVNVPVDIYSVSQRNTIDGFCEEETLRERLQKLLFAEGYYIKQTFVLYPEIRDGWYWTSLSDNDSKLIPYDSVYWKPRISDNTRYDKLTVFEYQYTQGTPSAGDETVTDGTTTWIVEKVSHTYDNIRYGVNNGKDVTVDTELTTIKNLDTVVDVSESSLFSAGSASCEVLIGDTETCPQVGDKVFLPYCPFVEIPLIQHDTGDVYGIVGFVEKEEIQFGNNAKASIIISGCKVVDTKKLVITYVATEFNNTLIRIDTYHFPVGYSYKIRNPKMHIDYNGVRYELSAEDEYLEDDMASQDTSVTVNVYSEEE